MPLYEYQCETCGARFERIQKYSDPPIDVCPSCAGLVRKLVSSPAIQFKGSGWYITDYATASEKSKRGEDKAADKPAAESGQKTETKDPGKKEAPADAKAAASPPPAKASE